MKENRPTGCLGRYALNIREAIYHVMNRGDRREAIFKDDQDRRCFIDTLGEACLKTAGKSGAELYDFVIEQAGLPKLMEHANVRKEIRFGEELVLGLD